MTKSHLEEAFRGMLMGWKIDFTRERQAIPLRKYRFDFYIPKIHALVEIQGGIWTKGAHSSGRGLLRDYKKHNLAVCEGYRILYYADVASMATFIEHYERLLNADHRDI